MNEISNTERVLQNFDHLLMVMRALKPNDRSDQDRYWAIAITETEKALGLFNTFVHQNYGTEQVVAHTPE